MIIVIDRDLDFKQSVDIIIDADLDATENKQLEIYIKYRLGVQNNVPVETKILDTIELPIYYNSVTQLSNSANNWKSINFEVDLNKSLQLNTGGILEVPIVGNYNLVNNSFKIGDSLLLEDFTIGTISQIDFSGQYKINSIGLTNSYIYLDVNNNKTLMNYGSSASNIVQGGLPLPFNSTTYTYLLSNKPYLDLNKGYKYRMSCKIKGSSTFFSVKRDTIIDLPVTEVKIIFDK